MPGSRIAPLFIAAAVMTLTCRPEEARVEDDPGRVGGDRGAAGLVDRIELPPGTREFASPGERYVLAVEIQGLPKNKHGSARLYRSTDGRREPVWEARLPHEYGPRYAVVDARGSVLLVDEWINIASRHALVLFDSAGREVAHYGFDDIQRVLEVERRGVSAHAKLGVWMTTPPALDGERGVVTIETSGKVLAVRMSDGRLSVDG